MIKLLFIIYMKYFDFFFFEKIKYFDLDLRNCKLQQQPSLHFGSGIRVGYLLSNESGKKYNLFS